MKKNTNLYVAIVTLLAMLLALISMTCIGAVTAVSVRCEQNYGSDYGIEEWCSEGAMMEYEYNSKVCEFFGVDYDNVLDGLKNLGV